MSKKKSLSNYGRTLYEDIAQDFITMQFAGEVVRLGGDADISFELDRAIYPVHDDLEEEQARLIALVNDRLDILQAEMRKRLYEADNGQALQKAALLANKALTALHLVTVELNK